MTVSNSCDIVVYLFDEEAAAALCAAATAHPRYQFIAVHASRAGTVSAVKLERAARRLPNVTLVDIEIDLGRGAAFRAGSGVAVSEYTALVDLAEFVDLSVLAPALRTLAQDRSLSGVIGDRWHSATRQTTRRSLSQAYAGFTRALFGLQNRDVQSPLKVFRTATLREVLGKLRLFATGFDAELLFEFRRAGFRLADMPFRWEESSSRQYHSARSLVKTVYSLIVVRTAVTFSEATVLRWVGRHFVIPAKSHYSIALFAWRDPCHPAAGGGEVYLHEQARYWSNAGHRVTWYAQRFAGSLPEEEIDGIRIVRIAPVPWVFAAGAVSFHLNRDGDFDFVIDCMNGIPFFTPLFTSKPKFLLIYHIHTPHFRAELPPLAAAAASFVETQLVPLVYRNTAVVTISESTRQELVALKMSRFPITVVHSGVSEDIVPGPKAERPTILYLGRLRQYKRVDKLIEAFVAVKDAVPDARLVIAGVGDDLPRLRGLAERLGIRDVTFEGRVSEERKRRLMQEAWVFAMPSSIEGWGIVVIEANASGTPAVGYRVAGTKDCIVDGVTGLLADDDARFAKALERVLSDQRLRAALAEASRDWAQRFSWRISSETTLEHLRRAQPWRAVFEALPSGNWRVVHTAARPSIGRTLPRSV
jgi:glycosyltransferase involved in cell wall biosynthesis